MKNVAFVLLALLLTPLTGWSADCQFKGDGAKPHAIFLIHGLMANADSFGDAAQLLHETYAQNCKKNVRVHTIEYFTNPSREGGILNFHRVQTLHPYDFAKVAYADMKAFLTKQAAIDRINGVPSENQFSLDTPYSIMVHSQGGITAMSILQSCIQSELEDNDEEQRCDYNAVLNEYQTLEDEDGNPHEKWNEDNLLTTEFVDNNGETRTVRVTPEEMYSQPAANIKNLITFGTPFWGSPTANKGVSLVVVAILTIGVPGLLIYFLYAQRRIDRVGVIGFRGVRKDLIEKEDHTLFQNRLEFLELTGDANVVVALFGKERSPEVLIEMGASLTEGGKLEVAHVTEIPEQTTFTDIADESPQVRALRRRINALAVKQNVSVRFDPILAHDVMKTIHQISSRLHCDWLVTEWGGRSRGTFTLHNPIGWLRNHLQCNLITFRDTGVRYVRKVLVVIQGGDYDRLVLSTADQFARNNEAKLTVVKVVGTKLPDREVNTATMLLSTLVTSCCHSQTETQILRSDKRGEDILSLAVEFDLLVLGTKQKQTLWETHFGTEVDNIIAQAPCSVVSVQAGREI